MIALDIVIPARGETATLEACLASLAAQAAGLDLHVIVAVNGPDSDATLAAATRGRRALDALGVSARIVECPAAGKAVALNQADQARRGCAVLYLDADVVLLPGALAALAAVLASPRAVLAAPPMRVTPPSTPIARAFTRVWASLPAVAGDVVGAGCYGVSAAGRTCWGAFPDLIADDAFVRSLFQRGERQVTEVGGFLISLPDGAALIRTVRRWHAGNRQLGGLPPSADGAQRDPTAGALRNLAHVARRPDLWTSLPAYLYVRLAAALATYPGAGSAWAPHRTVIKPR